MNTKAVSIVIPTYNAEKYIKNCLDSVRDQLGAEDEVIIIDDGSTDGTAAICRQYVCDQIHYYYQDNSGVSVARNRGLNCAKGDWILFVDADDALLPGSLSKAKGAINHKSEYIVLGSTSSTDKVTGKYPSSFQETNIDALKLLFSAAANKRQIPSGVSISHFNMWACWGRLYRKDLLCEYGISFDSELFLGEDLLFNVHYLLHIRTVDFLNDYGYYYRPNDGQVTARFQENRVVNTLRLIEKIKTLIGNGGVSDVLEGDINRFIADRCIACYEKYFKHPDNPLTKEERTRQFADFLNAPQISEALQKTSVFNLTSGKKAKYIWGIYVLLMKKRKIGILMKL